MFSSANRSSELWRCRPVSSVLSEQTREESTDLHPGGSDYLTDLWVGVSAVSSSDQIPSAAFVSQRWEERSVVDKHFYDEIVHFHSGLWFYRLLFVSNYFVFVYATEVKLK